MRYRKVRIPGDTYFCTVKLVDRQRNALVHHAEILREVMRKWRIAHPFHIDALVVFSASSCGLDTVSA